MRVNFSRLEKKLLPSDFALISVNAASFPDCTFVRMDADPRLYQHIYVSLGRRIASRNEVADAELAVTPMRWHSLWGGLSERRILHEVASNVGSSPPRRLEQWDTDIKTTVDAKTWEDLVARVGPPAAAEFAVQVGPAVLQRTEKARTVATRALAKLDSTAPILRQIEDLRRTMGGDFATQAEMATRAIGRIPEASDIYTLAGLAIANDDECRATILSAVHPLLTEEIGWPVYLLTDAILSWSINEDIRADLRFLKGRQLKGNPEGAV